METIKEPMVEYGVAKFVLPGQEESGDHHLVRCNQNGVLVAAIDGIGHGEEAAEVARVAAEILQKGLDEPIISLVEQCHEKLRGTRGVVLSLASIDSAHGMMTWLGVGNVQGVLVRADRSKGNVKEGLLLRAGVVGSRLPSLQASVLPMTPGDTLFFVTDGIHSGFTETLTALENPQRAANRILDHYRSGNDDALALVVRLTGITHSLKVITRRKGQPQAGVEDEYRSSLKEYTASGGEPELRKAYELGRQALTERKGLVEMAYLHHHAVLELVRGNSAGKSTEQMLEACAEFLAECLSPYEMASRGFQDVVKALRQLNETLEEEIKRIANSVHDEAGQLLVAVYLALAEMGQDLAEPQQKQIARIKEMLNQVEKHLRRYSHELRPTILDDLGWIPAVRFLAEGISKRAELPIHIEATIPGRLPGAVETALYRVVQEALTNAVKHANAKNLWIRAWKEQLSLCCSIRDDGKGFDPGEVHAAIHGKGLGLIAMRERVSAIGGTLRIESRPGQGSEFCIRVPLEDDHANSDYARR